MVELPRPQPLGKLHRLAGSFGIHLLLDACLGVEIVDRREMEKVIDLAEELFLLGG